jgi:cyanate permease
MRLVQLRPFIRQVLGGSIVEEPPYHRAERWQDDPRYAIPNAGLFFAALMGAAMWLNDHRLPWWGVLALALASGLLFGTAMWFVHKHMKGR